MDNFVFFYFVMCIITMGIFAFAEYVKEYLKSTEGSQKSK